MCSSDLFHLRLGHALPALEAAKRVAAKAPEEMAVLLALARAQLAGRDPAGARGTLANARRQAAFDPARQVEIALLQLAAQDVAGAAYSLEKALSNGEFLPADALMAEVALRQGDTAQAERRARQIVQRHPRRAVGHSLLGDVAMARAQPAAALDAYRQAHRAEPSTDTLLRLFRTMATQGDTAGAVRLAGQWTQAHPQDVAARKALADGQARSADWRAARASYEAVLKTAPDDAEALNNLANVLLRLNDPAAVQVAERALARSPGDATLIDTLGWASHLAGQSGRSVQLLRDARLRQPDNADIRHHLAAALAAAGRRGEARDELVAALGSGRVLEDAAGAQALLKTLQ